MERKWAGMIRAPAAAGRSTRNVASLKKRRQESNKSIRSTWLRVAASAKADESRICLVTRVSGYQGVGIRVSGLETFFLPSSDILVARYPAS